MTSKRAIQACEEHNGCVHFTLQLQSEVVRAVLSESAWEARYGRLESDASLREIYIANQPMIEAAVVRRLGTDKQQPVVLRDLDL